MNASEVLRGLVKGGSLLAGQEATTNGMSPDLHAFPLKPRVNRAAFARRVMAEVSNSNVDVSQLLADLAVAEDVERARDDTHEVLELVSTRADACLWTEKYRPRKFIDLLGNERVNSMVLKWLKQWNKCVEGAKVDPDAQDPLDRPQKKFLLIHGPPGIGKTTIAHCIAHQLRYVVNEINSSDERGGEGVRQRILNALSANNLKGKRMCLVLDEADGASNREGGFLRMLVQMANKDRRAVQRARGGEKIKNADLLKRPIILLCNDVYAPALDWIKPHCEIVQFKRPGVSEMKKRLKRIAEAEHVPVPDTLLNDIVQAMEGDIRNCINFLQFNARGSAFLKDRLKDTQLAWFNTLKMVFNRKPNVRKSSQFEELFGDLANASEGVDKIVGGTFNALLQADGLSISKYDELNAWYAHYDQLHSNAHRDELAGYNLLPPMKAYTMLNEVGSQDMEFKSQFNFQQSRAIEASLAQMQYVNLSTNGDNLRSYERDMLFKIIVPLGIPPQKLSLDQARIFRSEALLKAWRIRIESFRSGTYMARETTNGLAPDISSPWCDSQAVSGYLGVVQRAASVPAVGMQNHLTVLKRKPDTEPISQAPAKRKGCAVDFFKKQYAGARASNAGSGTTDVPSPTLTGSNRIWVKYHEGFSNAVRKETSWMQLFGSGNYA